MIHAVITTNWAVKSHQKRLRGSISAGSEYSLCIVIYANLVVRLRIGQIYYNIVYIKRGKLLQSVTPRRRISIAQVNPDGDERRVIEPKTAFQYRRPVEAHPPRVSYVNQ